MSWSLLALGLPLALMVAASWGPVRRPGWLAVALWFPMLMCSERPWLVIGTSAAAALGLGLAAQDAVTSLPNLLGLGLLAASWWGLWYHAGHHAHVAPHRPPPDANLRTLRIRRERDIPYGADPKQKLDLYWCDEVPGPRPVVVYIHGGGWSFGDKALQGIPTLELFARHGWLAAGINYRLSPRATFPDHIVDVKAAIATLRRLARERGDDGDFVAALGGSAGGHLATLAALTPQHAPWQQALGELASESSAIDALVAFYGIYDFVDEPGHFARTGFQELLLRRWVMKRDHRDDHDAYREASPLHHVGPHAPPTLLIHGIHDAIAPVEGTHRMAEALAAHPEVLVRVVTLPGAHHGFELLRRARGEAMRHQALRFCQEVRHARTKRE